MQRVEQFGQADPLLQAGGAVDVDEQLRRIGFIDGKQAGEAGGFVPFGHHVVGLALQFDQAQIAAVLDHELEPARAPQA